VIKHQAPTSTLQRKFNHQTTRPGIMSCWAKRNISDHRICGKGTNIWDPSRCSGWQWGPSLQLKIWDCPHL